MDAVVKYSKKAFKKEIWLVRQFNYICFKTHNSKHDIFYPNEYMFYLPILGTPSGTRHPSSLFKSHANNTNLSTLICNSKRPVEKTLKIAESFRHLFWVEHKTYSRSLHQRWSILLQMTTLSPALEGSGPEVRVIVGLQLWVQRWRQMCLLLGWALSSDRENMKHGWGLPYSWKVVIILFPVFN